MRVPSRSGRPARFTQMTLATLAGLSLAASACAGSSSAVPDQPETRSAAVSRTALAPALLPSDKAVADRLASRYRRATHEVVRYVAAARTAGEALGLDPLLILAVMAVESSLDPEAESHYGAKGLMQIVPRFHRDSLDGTAVRRPSSIRASTFSSARSSSRPTSIARPVTSQQVCSATRARRTTPSGATRDASSPNASC